MKKSIIFCMIACMSLVQQADGKRRDPQSMFWHNEPPSEMSAMRKILRKKCSMARTREEIEDGIRWAENPELRDKDARKSLLTGFTLEEMIDFFIDYGENEECGLQLRKLWTQLEKAKKERGGCKDLVLSAIADKLQNFGKIELVDHKTIFNREKQIQRQFEPSEDELQEYVQREAEKIIQDISNFRNQLNASNRNASNGNVPKKSPRTKARNTDIARSWEHYKDLVKRIQEMQRDFREKKNSNDSSEQFGPGNDHPRTGSEEKKREGEKCESTSTFIYKDIELLSKHPEKFENMFELLLALGSTPEDSKKIQGILNKFFHNLSSTEKGNASKIMQCITSIMKIFLKHDKAIKKSFIKNIHKELKTFEEQNDLSADFTLSFAAGKPFQEAYLQFKAECDFIRYNKESKKEKKKEKKRQDEMQATRDRMIKMADVVVYNIVFFMNMRDILENLNKNSPANYQNRLIIKNLLEYTSRSHANVGRVLEYVMENDEHMKESLLNALEAIKDTPIAQEYNNNFVFICKYLSETFFYERIHNKCFNLLGKKQLVQRDLEINRKGNQELGAAASISSDSDMFASRFQQDPREESKEEKKIKALDEKISIYEKAAKEKRERPMKLKELKELKEEEEQRVKERKEKRERKLKEKEEKEKLQQIVFQRDSGIEERKEGESPRASLNASAQMKACMEEAWFSETHMSKAEEGIKTDGKDPIQRKKRETSLGNTGSD